MKCENLQFNIPVYFDDVLSGEERAAIDAHLVVCPLCRQKASEFQALRNNLRTLPRPEMPTDLLVSIRKQVALKTEVAERKSTPFFTEDVRRWLLMRLMPYSVGTVASVFLTFGLLLALLPNDNRIRQTDEIAKFQPMSKSMVLIANSKVGLNADDLTAPPVLDAAHLAISGETPAINPQGALIALTKSFVRGKMRDDEVVVVAEVFGNGLARIDEVVEPSRDRRAVRELENALKSDPNYAPPFMPAHLDRRADSVRVILKIQSVNIDTHLKRK